MMHWQQLLSYARLGRSVTHERTEYRSEFQRDYDRLIFSAPFRRMQNKTQVFPLPGSVFVHNRLTHSLEVSSVGRSLGNDVGRVLASRHPEVPSDLFASLGAIVSAACLAHDMGNPPFGHSGEAAITSFFREGQGQALRTYRTPGGEQLTDAQWHDLIHFDGNANAFRLLTHRFEGRRPGGFVMTYATLASIIKYPYASSCVTTKSKFGFFEAERQDFVAVAQTVGLRCLEDDGVRLRYARHPLVYLVEAADDICYEVMDIEDAHKLHLLTDAETLSLLLAFFAPAQQAELRKVFACVTDVNEQIVYLRSAVIGTLEQACVQTFLQHEADILAGTFSGTLLQHLPSHLCQAYEACAQMAVARIYRSRDVVDIELSGYRIIYTLLELMIQAVLHPEEAYSRLLINRVPSQYQLHDATLYGKVMAVLDYVSGMTDVYAVDLYRKINGHSLPMV